MKHKFPKFLHVKIENEGEEEEYFDASDDCQAHAEIGEQVKVGVYKLVEVRTVACRYEVVGKSLEKA